MTDDNKTMLTPGWLADRLSHELRDKVEVVSLVRDEDPNGFVSNIYNAQVLCAFFFSLTHMRCFT